MGKKRCIGFAVKMLSNLIKREADHGMQEIWQEGLTASQCRIIGYLYCNRGRDVFQKELEDYLSIRRSTVTQMLQLMERNGLLRRVSAEQDARQKRLLLTARGEELQKRGMQCIDGFEQKLCEGISEAELDAFMQTMEKLTANLKRMSE